MLQTLFEMPVTIHIDDTVAHAHPRIVKYATRPVDVLHHVLGLLISEDKPQTTLCRRPIKVLGINATVEESTGRVSFAATKERKEKIKSMIPEVIQQFETEREPPIKSLQALLGQLAFFSSFRRKQQGAALVAPLYVWLPTFVEKKFRKENQKRLSQHILKITQMFPKIRLNTVLTLKQILVELDAIPDVYVDLELNPPQVWHIWPDWANPTEGKGGSLLRIGGQKDEKAMQRCFKTGLDMMRLPKPISCKMRENVAIGELLMVFVVVILFDLRNGHLFVHTDNVYNCYSSVAGRTRHNPLITAIIEHMTEEFMCRGIIDFYTYVNTKRNPGDIFTRSDRFALIAKMLGFPLHEVEGFDLLKFITNNLPRWLQRESILQTIITQTDKTLFLAYRKVHIEKRTRKAALKRRKIEGWHDR